jgi:hypothetical protein
MKELVVMFHDKIYPDMHTNLGMKDFGSGNNKDFIGIKKGEKEYGSTVQQPDVIIISDIDISGREDIKSYITQSLEGRETLFVGYHSNVNLREIQSNTFESLLSSQSIEYVPDSFSHSPGDPIYEAVLDLARVVANVKQDLSYENAFGRLVSAFGFDKALEARLELLHNCLTPEGFANVTVDRNGNATITLANQQKIQYNIGGSGWSAYKALKDKADDGPFDKEYIAALSALRDELLKNYQ